MTRCFALLGLTLAVVASISHAASPKVAQFYSCVGTDYEQLKPTSALHAKSDAVCLTRGDMAICRSKLNEDQGNDTSEIVVSTSNGVIARWREQGDPAYLNKVLAFNAHQRHRDVLIIATLQSVSQGMGVQEWSVNAMKVIEGVESSRRTLTTADFGIDGSILRAKAHATDDCHLLTTRWEERDTKQGKRLFLVGELVGLFEEQKTAPPFPFFVRRLDHGLASLRLSDRTDRPLVFFQK